MLGRGGDQEESMMDNYEEYTDEELRRAWDNLEKYTLTPYVEEKMDAIQAEIDRRERRREMS